MPKSTPDRTLITRSPITVPHIPKYTHQPKRSNSDQLELEPCVNSPSQSVRNNSQRTGSLQPPETNTLSNAVAQTSPRTSQHALTPTGPREACSSILMRPGAPGAGTLATNSDGTATQPQFTPAAVVADTAMQAIERARGMLDLTPPPLKSALNGELRERLPPLTIGMVECQSLTFPRIDESSNDRPRSYVSVVRLNERHYRILRAYVATYGKLAKQATDKEIMASVKEGMIIWGSRVDAAFSGAVPSKIVLNIWIDALRDWPLWVIRASFRHCSITRQHPPVPVDVIEVCRRLWSEAKRWLMRAMLAVADCERERPEWGER